MPVPTVRLKIRVRLSNGSRAYVDPVVSANGKLKPLYAIVDGKPEYHPEGIYNLRYVSGGCRKWEAVGTDSQQALIAKLQVEHKLQAVALGFAAPDPISVKTHGRTDLAEAIAEYLKDTAAGKSKRTSLAYTYTLNTFTAICTKTTLEKVDRRDVLNFVAHLKGLGNSPRTVSNYVNFLLTFFRRHNATWPLLKTDKIKFTDKIVSAYNSIEVNKLLAASDLEEADLLQFFLCTGARDREVQFATWPDVDFISKTFAVTEKLDLHYSPKDREEGEIPIPDSIVEMLRARQKRQPGTRLIFPGLNGKPNRHFLRVLKRLALRAGMNCGHCNNKVGECCATKPTCKRFELHRFRKTFATMHHEAGVPVRTISRWLRHSDLETTLRYLASSDDKSERTRTQVNSTWAFVPKVGVPDEGSSRRLSGTTQPSTPPGTATTLDASPAGVLEADKT